MYQLGTTNVGTKKQCQDFAKAILNRGKVGEVLEGKSLDFMLAFFKTFHHEWKQKQGLGVAEIRREINPNNSRYRAFVIERIDGSSTDISYTISNIEKDNAPKDFRNALRQIIKPQIDNFRNRAFSDADTLICPLTSELVTAATCHIDHMEPTFEKLVQAYIRCHDLTDLRSLIKPHRDNQTHAELKDPALAEDFYYYHKMNARLRVLSPTGNLSHAKKES